MAKDTTALIRMDEYGPNAADECEYGACVQTPTHGIAWKLDGTAMELVRGRQFCRLHANAAAAVNTVRHGLRS